MKTTTRVLLAAALCFVVVGCARQVQEEAPPPPTTAPPTTTEPAPTAGVFGPEDLDTDACLRQRVVYFDFDQEALRPEFQAQMACHAKYLRDRPSARITLEGHADERGSRDYNLGLGERRGNAVSSALQANGGSGTQLTTVSYGEERPQCTDTTEDCWAQNRRVEIVYTAR